MVVLFTRSGQYGAPPALGLGTGGRGLSLQSGILPLVWGRGYQSLIGPPVHWNSTPRNWAEVHSFLLPLSGPPEPQGLPWLPGSVGTLSLPAEACQPAAMAATGWESMCLVTQAGIASGRLGQPAS